MSDYKRPQHVVTTGESSTCLQEISKPSRLIRRRCRCISVSGPDGSGKSSQIEAMRLRLKCEGDKPVVIWMRLGYTPGINCAKSLLRVFMGSKLPTAGNSRHRSRLMRNPSVRWLWLGVAIADLLVTLVVRVRVQKLQGHSVICDRYFWDSLVDRRVYFPTDLWAESILRRGFDWFGLKPTISILLLLPLEEAMRRSDAKAEPFPDTVADRTQRQIEYRALGTEDPSLLVVDASRPLDEVSAEIARLL